MIFKRTYNHRFTLAFVLFVCSSLVICLHAENKIEIPFQLINGLTVIQAEIDGVKGAYLLDTGSDGIILHGETNTHHSQSEVISLGGATSTSTQALSELKVGTFNQTQLEAQITSLTHIKDHLGIDLKGIIGGYLFQPKVVIVDFQKSVITLVDKFDKEEKDKFSNKVNINTSNYIPVAKVKIENKWYKFALDSGSSIHFVDPVVLNELNIVTEIDQMANMKCLANKTSEKIKKQSIAKFEFGGVAYTNQICLPRSFDEVNNSTDLDLDGILSLSKLVKETVVFDYTKAKLYF